MAISRFAIFSLLALLLLSGNLVRGHGNMVQPMAWYDEDQLGWEWDENGASTHLGCGVLDMPADNEFTITNDKEPDCYNYWFSNQVREAIQWPLWTQF